MKRVVSLKHRLLAVAIISPLLTSVAPASAGVLFTTIGSSGTTYGFVNQVVAYQPITIPSAATIKSLEMKIAVLPASGLRVDIYPDSAGSPSSASLGALTYSSYSSPTGFYTGSVSLPTAGKYWFKFSSTSGFQNYYSMTPVLTGSVSGWSVGRMLESTNSGTSFSTRSDDLVFLMTINGTGGGLAPSASTISLSAASPSTYRLETTITASLGVSGTDGKVTFYANNKKIPGCINKFSSGLSVSCNWKPANRGSTRLTAKLIPSDESFLSSTSPAKNILVANRVTKR